MTGLIVDFSPEPPFAQFTGGGSKDEEDIDQWRHRTGNPPDKDDLTNAYAAAYTHPDTGNLILVFGMDRFDTSGDAQLGFWFLQGAVQPVEGGTFSGVHQVDDILVLVNFSKGGGTPTIAVFRWDGNTAVPVPDTAGPVLCMNGFIPAGQSFCGITNTATATAPWEYFNKDVDGGNTPTTNFPAGGFFEGAIDLTAIGIEPCITNFLAESRSSTSITSVLKDFATPEEGFNLCGIEVTKECANPRLNQAQNMIIYDISGKVTTKGAVFNVALSDSPPADGAFQRVNCEDPSEVIGTFPVTSLAAGEEACYKNTITVPLDQNGLSDTVTATANTKADNTGVELTDSATVDPPCPNLQISPALSISKTCESMVEVIGNQVVVRVDVKAKVCNIGDTNLSSVAVTDNHAGALIGPNSLPATNPDTCEDYTGSYFPSEVNSPLPSEVMFTDTATATATDIFGDPVTQQSDVATCPLCPASPVQPTSVQQTTSGESARTEALAPGTHTLKVNKGRGSGRHVAGDMVTVTADAPPRGKKFAGWSGDIQVLANPSISPTTATMPSIDVTVSATYADVSSAGVQSSRPVCPSKIGNA